jgi:hypothetical protein
MNPTYALILAIVSAFVIAGVGSRFRTPWPWYLVAAIILASCAYAYVEPEHWFASSIRR